MSIIFSILVLCETSNIFYKFIQQLQAFYVVDDLCVLNLTIIRCIDANDIHYSMMT